MNDTEHPDTLMDQRSPYPLVALRDMVVFPRTRTTLSMMREKLIRAVEEAMMQPEHLLITAAQQEAEIDDPQPKDIYSVGTLVEVTTMHRQQDGSFQILLQGLRRVQIEEFVEQEPFLRVIVEPLIEEQPHGSMTDAVVRHATNLFERYAQLNRKYTAEDITSIVSQKTAARLSDTLATFVVTDFHQQQELLEMLDPLARLEKICVLMGNEIEILELESTIRTRVRSQVDRSQKEFYLREHLRAIQEELGMEGASEANELRDRVNELAAQGMPLDVTNKTRKEIDRLERTPPQSADIASIRSYIDWILALPWSERTDDHFDIETTRRILEEDHYGLEGIKERILEFLAVRQLRQRRASRAGVVRQESQGQILCFIGPPGVGKTSLGQSIARALGRKFARIALGGVSDEAEIRGHRRTYVGALPGRIIQSMKTVGVRNPVFLLDEVDKLSSEYRGDPAAALLEVLDSAQNNVFVDHYLEVPFDLSEVFFICTGNVRYQVPRPLLDRMDVIDLPGYILEEKINIGSRHLLPRVLAEHGIAPEQLKIPQAVMQHIVTDYTREAGVRALERQLTTICRKSARRIFEKPDTHIRVTTHNLENYLGAPRYLESPINHTVQVGVALGLAVTDAGGMVLPVEVVTMPGKGEVLITGQLGEVMRESAFAALSYIRSRAKDLELDPNFQDSTDMHIHMPENALPKEGPSAGIAIATALISALTHRPVRGDLAMTGEITLRGRVLAIGGLKEKTLAAHAANIFQLLIPADNKKDLAEIPAKIRQHMTFITVETMDHVIESALLAAPADEDQEQNQNGRDEEAAPEPPPHHLDERNPGSRRRHTPDVQEGEDEAGGHRPFIIPPNDSNRELYP
ncbi:MAG TPA: endopeptidase La [Ktedonobacteraceae bacterium]|nr:endopeptidase La [Ktedonobacteraceae bacterium]